VLGVLGVFGWVWHGLAKALMAIYTAQ